jgi:hypothetical protein
VPPTEGPRQSGGDLPASSPSAGGAVIEAEWGGGRKGTRPSSDALGRLGGAANRPRLGRLGRDRVRVAVLRAARLVDISTSLSVRTLDGELLTGLIIADRGQVLVFLGTRTVPGGRASPRPDRGQRDATELVHAGSPSPRDYASERDSFRRPPTRA